MRRSFVWLSRSLVASSLVLIGAAPGCASSAEPDPDSDIGHKSAAIAASVVMLPTSDVTNDHVVGVGDTAALYHDVDDGAALTAADDSTTYVRGEAAVAATSHTVGYSGGPSGTVTDVTVSWRAQRGSAQGTAQVLLYNGTSLVGSGAVQTLGSWASYTDTFSGLSVANASNLRTKVVFQNTAATGALRYTQIFLSVTTGGTCTPTTCAAQGKNCGSISDGCGGTLTCGSCTAPQTCGGGGVANVCGTGTPSALCGSTAPPPAKYKHVVVVMEENRTWSAVGGVGFGSMPYLKSLAQQCTTFSDWTETNTSQNSLNQYIGLTSGISNTATVNDCSPSTTCRSTDNNIFRQVRLAGGTARNFVEGATTGCSAAGNAAKHVPAMYYYGTYTDASGASHSDHDFCATEVRPLTELDVNNLPTFAMITPNLCNDGHDCANATVDTWASTLLPRIFNGANYLAGDTLVVVLYDEDHPVPNLLIAPTAKAGVNSTSGAGHAAMLKTWEEMLGLPVMPQGQLPSAISLRSPAHI